MTTPASGGALGRHARRLVNAYTGEHGVYGLVLVTALVAIGDEYDSDLEVLVFVVGTTLVFWLAHVYAGIVAAGGHAERGGESFLRRAGHAASHSSGMLLAMLPPALVLAMGVLGLVDEDEAYDFALIIGLIVLALIGWGNARRNGRRWPMQIVGALSTTMLGALVILLSILVH